MTIKSLTIEEFRKLTDKMIREQLTLVKKVLREAEDPTTLSVDDVVDTIQKTKTVEDELARIKALPPTEQQMALFDLKSVLDGYESGDREQAQAMSEFYPGWTLDDFESLHTQLDDHMRQERLAGMKAEKDAAFKASNKGKEVDPTLSDKETEELAKQDTSTGIKKVWANKAATKAAEMKAKPEVKKDFGSWAKKAFAGKIPSTIPDKEVLSWIADNKTALANSPTEIFVMYKDHLDLQKNLGKPGEKGGGKASINKTLEKVSLEPKQKPAAKQKDEYGGKLGALTPMENIGAALGMSKQNVDKMLDKIMTKMQDWVVGVKETGPSGKTYMDMEFDLTDGFMDALDEAATKYVTFLEKAVQIAKADPTQGDFSVEDFLDPFNEYVLKAAKLPQEDIKDAERLAIQYMAELIEAGQKDKAIDYLKRDIARMGPAAEVVRTFSTYLARYLYPETRGRKPGSKASESEE